MLQSAALGKEEQRILAMKARAEARTHRFLNARSRTIGIDVNGLNAQIAEKKQMKEAQRQADADQCKFDTTHIVFKSATFNFWSGMMHKKNLWTLNLASN